MLYFLSKNVLNCFSNHNVDHGTNLSVTSFAKILIIVDNLIMATIPKSLFLVVCIYRRDVLWKKQIGESYSWRRDSTVFHSKLNVHHM